MIASLIIAVLLFAVSAWCKAAMDTKVFQSRLDAFKSSPDWFRVWMHSQGKMPIIKMDDGWHTMQALMFLALGVGYLLCGIWYSEVGLWVFLAIPVRTVVHGIVFEAFYPMR